MISFVGINFSDKGPSPMVLTQEPYVIHIQVVLIQTTSPLISVEALLREGRGCNLSPLCKAGSEELCGKRARWARRMCVATQLPLGSVGLLRLTRFQSHEGMVDLQDPGATVQCLLAQALCAILWRWLPSSLSPLACSRRTMTSSQQNHNDFVAFRGLL